MPRIRNEEAQKIAHLLDDYEVAIEVAISKGALLAAELPRARQASRFGAVVGQNALSRLLASVTSLGAARGEAVDAHTLLDSTREHFGLTVTGGGDKENSPEPGGIEREERQPMRLVG